MNDIDRMRSLAGMNEGMGLVDPGRIERFRLAAPEEQVKLMYMWIKQDVINTREFSQLLQLYAGQDKQREIK